MFFLLTLLLGSSIFAQVEQKSDLLFENQDPLKPVDQKKFAADLAQFSQLEQLANMKNEK